MMISTAHHIWHRLELSLLLRRLTICPKMPVTSAMNPCFQVHLFLPNITVMPANGLAIAYFLLLLTKECHETRRTLSDVRFVHVAHAFHRADEHIYGRAILAPYLSDNSMFDRRSIISSIPLRFPPLRAFSAVAMLLTLRSKVSATLLKVRK